MHLFVYGSLKQGECNFHQVSRWVRSVRPARAPGQLYLRPDGYPALCLGSERWLEVGTRDHAHDVSRCAGSTTRVEGSVPGQLLELDQPEVALVLLDWFEGYQPGELSEYWRVLLPIYPDRLAWTYVCRPEQVSDWPAIESWPPPGASTPGPYQGSRQG